MSYTCSVKKRGACSVTAFLFKSHGALLVTHTNVCFKFNYFGMLWLKVLEFTYAFHRTTEWFRMERNLKLLQF